MKHRGAKFTRKKHTLLTLSLGACLLSSATAETNLTLQAALETGEADNPQLQAAYQRWQAAQQNIIVRKSLPDPMLTYGYYVEPIETKTGPQRQSFGFSQKIPAFGKRSTMEAIATDAANAAGQRYQTEKLKLDDTIARAYAGLYYLERSLAITQDRIRLIEDLEKVARTHYKAGAPMASVLQAQLELGRLEERLQALNDLRKPKTAKLNALLGRAPETPLRIATSLPIPSNPSASLQSNPELRELEERVKQGAHQLQLAHRERRPNIILGMKMIDTEGGDDPIIGTIGLSLPLWPDKNRARIQSAANLKTAAELTLENRQRTLDADHQQAQFDLRDAERKINLYKESLIPKARQSLEVTRQSYEAGNLEFINLIDAERTLLEFELAY